MNSEFKIKFDGEHHQIDANVLINSLIHTTSIIQEINRNLDSGKRIDVKIKALEKGSFLIHIDLIESSITQLKNLLTRDNIATGGIIISSLVGLFTLKKHLKGKPPKSQKEKGNKVEIQNQNGDTIIIENFVQNIYESSPIVKDAISQNFQSLENDPSITGFEITDKNEKPLIRIERTDFETLSVKSEELLENEKTIIVPAALNIVRVAFDKNLKWEFYFKGNKITAKLDDTDFQIRIDKGASFSKGDTLEVDLEIKQKFEE